VGFPESLEGLEGDAPIASETVKLVHHDDVEQADPSVCEHLLEGRPFREVVRAGATSLIPIHLDNLEAMRLAVELACPILGVKRIPLNLLLAGDAFVEGSPYRAGT
jgi:hypothetical protein